MCCGTALKIFFIFCSVNIFLSKMTKRLIYGIHQDVDLTRRIKK